MQCFLVFATTLATLSGATAAESWNFTFGTEPMAQATHVSPATEFDPQLGHGFLHFPAEAARQLSATGDALRPGLKSREPYVFAIQTGEGRFRVSARFEGPSEQAGITIKAESRRLMVHEPDLHLDSEQTRELRFVTDVRTPTLDQGGEVLLNPREKGVWHWDDLLQIEIHSDTVLNSLSVERVDDLPVLYLLGDSTVTDQTTEPWTGWGQMLPVFFNPTLVIANHAESGETLRQFRAQRRLEKIMDKLKPGDFVMLQFGHNDMKESGEGIGPMQSYADDLRYFVKHLQGRGAQPLLVTSMKRRRFDEQGRQYATLGDYPLAVRKVAAELAVPLIDLNLMSGVLFAALGPEGSKQAFVHYPAGSFSGQDEALRDDSHFSPYGGYALANCVVEAIKIACPELAQHLRKDLKLYDPASPTKPDSLHIPASPRASVQAPEGS